MEIPQGAAGHARPNRPRQPLVRAAPAAEQGAESAGRPLPAPVPVTTQVLPLSVLSDVRPRERPAGLAAAEGYGAALGVVRD